MGGVLLGAPIKGQEIARKAGGGLYNSRALEALFCVILSRCVTFLFKMDGWGWGDVCPLPLHPLHKHTHTH